MQLSDGLRHRQYLDRDALADETRYQRAFLGFQVGQAAAMGVVVVVATIIIATFALRLIFKTFSGTEQAA